MQNADHLKLAPELADERHTHATGSRFATLDENEKEDIVSATESMATKRHTKYGVKILRRMCQINTQIPLFPKPNFCHITI